MSVRLEANAIRALGRAIANGAGYDFPFTGGAGSLATLSDVTLSGVQDGDALIFDASTNKWVNGQPRYASLAKYGEF